MAQLNRLESTRVMGGLFDAYWEELRQAHEQGKKIAWTCGAPPYIHLAAQDIPYHHAESFGAYVSARHQEAPFLEACDAAGYSPEVCSYERVSFGHIELLRRGTLMEEVGDRKYSLPTPDFAYTSRCCPNHAAFVDAIARIYNIPRVIIDVPIHVLSPSDYAESRAYVERQFREVFVPAVEQLTGRPYDWDQLKEQTRVLKRVIELRSYCMDLCKTTRPAPMTIFDAFVSIAVVVAMAGRPETIPFYESLKAEVDQRVAQGIGAITDEKYRLYYDHIPIWYKIGDWAKKLAGYGANIIAATYTHSEGFPRFADSWDPERPLESLADFQLRTNRYALPEYKLNFIIEACQDYSIDGVIFHNHRTCRYLDLDQYETARALERTLGIPSVIIDADSCDPQFYYEDQVDAQLEEFMEVVETRKRAGRV